MSKARAVGILAVMILCGVILLSTLAVAAGDPSFATLQGPFLQGCAEQAAIRDDPFFAGGKAFHEACRFVVRALRHLAAFNATTEEIQEAFADELLSRTPANCDKCLQTVGDLETTLATNNTDRHIVDALVAGCERRFSDPAEADQCRQAIANLQLPFLFDFLLTNHPPLDACREAQSCPLQ
jgi:hypothetical protein